MRRNEESTLDNLTITPETEIASLAVKPESRRDIIGDASQEHKPVVQRLIKRG